MKPASLRARMAVAALVVSTLTATLLVVGVVLLLNRSNDRAIRSRLEARVSAAAVTVVQDSNGVRVLEQRSPLLEQNVWVFDNTGNLIAGTLAQPALAHSVTRLGSSSLTRAMTAGDISFLARPVRRHGTRIATVVAAEDHEPYERAERSSIWLTLGLGVATVGIATAASWVAATRSLRQVQAMADLADDWGEHDVGRRFAPGPGGDEIAHLGRTLDQLLDRIVDSLASERRLTDEIAHELRTPLAVILAEADLAREHADGIVREGMDNIRGAAVTMRDSIDTMLSVARAHAAGGGRVSVGQVMDALGLPPSTYDDVRLAAPISPLVAGLRPLLENAVRHGAGAPRVEVTRDGRTVVISVLDDGPGVPPGDLERVFAPGHTTSDNGFGLGLALSRRVIRAVGGDVVARPGPGGHFDVRVPAR